MRGKDQMERGEGERMHAQRQRNFWKVPTALTVIALICGFVAGFVSGFADASGIDVDPLLKPAGAAGVFIAALLTIYFSWKFFVSVDEVEVADNLWSSLAGFYTYAILLPAWWALNRLGFVEPPHHWLIYGISIVTALAAYAWRKWRSR